MVKAKVVVVVVAAVVVVVGDGNVGEKKVCSCWLLC